MNHRLDTLSRLKSSSAVPVTPADRPLVHFEEYSSIPTYTPAATSVDLAEWASHNRDDVQARLLKHGALLFRGFHIDTPASLERFCLSLTSELFADNGEHPRGNLSEHVYTPVFYAPEKRLLWHNENSFNEEWPRLIWFCCAKPAESGGETPIVDSREVFNALDADIRDEFVRKGVMYVRNYSQGPGLDWETVFQTKDRSEVEARCREEGMDFEWKGDNGLKTSSTRPAAIPHPITGEMSWFNQAQHWHVACLDPDTQAGVRSLFAPEDYPRTCTFGDGTRISDDAMLSILAAYENLECSFPWQTGDVMMVDNVLAAHGRNAFSGERKLLVAMGEMTSYRSIDG